MLHAAALRTLGVRTLALVGAINAARLLTVADLEAIDVETHISTDDGSIGHHGFVTEVLTQILEQPQVYELYNPVIYACGPPRYASRCDEDFPIVLCTRTTSDGEPDGLCNGGLPRLREQNSHAGWRV